MSLPDTSLSNDICNTSPAVSVILPCHNSQETVGNAITSVRNQDFRELELIVIDDCSTDGSADIIRRHARQDPRIVCLGTDVNSRSPALPRNIGIGHARGSYIAFIDSDDMWHPDKLSRQLSFMKRYGYDVTYSYYEKAGTRSKHGRRIVRTRKTATYNDMLRSNHIPLLTAMLRKEVIGDTRFSDGLLEDYCFWLDILKKGHTAYNLREATAVYRQSRHSRSSDKSRMARDFWNVIRHREKKGLARCCLNMSAYTVTGLLKYIK